ncbi:MAG TPA: hypothetical protein VIM51_10835 [Desulfosporosinus sp.]
MSQVWRSTRVEASLRVSRLLWGVAGLGTIWETLEPVWRSTRVEASLRVSRLLWEVAT